MTLMSLLRKIRSNREQAGKCGGKNEAGVAMVEYAILVAGVVVFVLGCIALFSAKIMDLLAGIDF
jgi:Flp pilus assembly pilin Flp